MKHVMNRDKLKRVGKLCDRFLGVFLVHLILLQFLYLLLPMFNPFRELEELYFHGNLPTILCLVIIAPFFYSLVRMTAIYDDPLREKYFANEKAERRLREKLIFLFRQKQFWVGTVAYVALYLLLPLKWSYAVLLDVFLKGQDSMSGKLSLLILLFPLFFTLHIAAHCAAIRFWESYRKGKSGLYYVGEKKEKTYERLMATTYMTYIIIGGLAGIIVPLGWHYGPVFWELLWPKGIVTIAVVIILLYGLLLLRAYLKRRAFWRRLNKMCRANTCEVSEINRPYRSIFTLYDGASFRVKRNGKEYACKFISVTRKSKSIVLHPNGVYEFIRAMRSPAGTVNLSGRGYDFGFDADCRKVLIINPTPKQIFNERLRLLDNGDMVGEYKIYTGTAFLNALERDCVDKKLNR